MAYVNTVANVDAGIVARLVAAYKTVGERFARYNTYRNTVIELNALSGRELADLGVSRANIRAIAYKAAYGN